MLRALIVALIVAAGHAESTGFDVEQVCSLYAIEEQLCGQSDLDCKYASYAKAFMKQLKDGTCESQGYTVLNSTTTKKVPVIGEIKITEYTKPKELDAGEVCSLYAIDGPICGQSDLDCKYASYAKAFQRQLKDGTCESQGYTVLNSTTTKKVPVIGEIKITEYTKPKELDAGEVCSLYAIDGPICGQSDLDCKYAGYAKAFQRQLKDGTCESQGYTVLNSTTTKKVPVIGEIKITEYTKPSVLTLEAEPCCENKCKDPSEAKYYSIAVSAFGVKHCGECCMDPKSYPLYHIFETNLTRADNDNPCKTFGYTKYDSTVTHGFWKVKMTLDLYDLPKEQQVIV